MKNFYRHITAWLLLVFAVATAVAQDNDKILNRQYADRKQLHFGFSFGANFQGLSITNNGRVTDDGEQWWADIPSHSPGFSVNVLADYRLGTHFNLRVSPGVFCGNMVVLFSNAPADPESLDPLRLRQRQNVKATYVVLPVDLKISALRYHNMRPYVTTGVMGLFDVGKERSEQYRLKDTDVMLTVGMGCDFYLPFFKLCPEVKFCFGLRNLIDRNRPDLQDNEQMYHFTEAVDKVQDNMVVLTFYFE